jgi:hypothetical protein
LSRMVPLRRGRIEDFLGQLRPADPDFVRPQLARVSSTLPGVRREDRFGDVIAPIGRNSVALARPAGPDAADCPA